MISVAAAIIARNGRVFIAKRRPPGRMPGMWEFPGGKIESGETPEQCLARELREELDIDAAVGDLVGTHRHAYDFYTVNLLVYRATIVDGTITLNDHADMAWASAEELGGYRFAPADRPFVEMIRKGEIRI
jgi:8-oxo-dGTP diphosphatase